MTETHNIKTVPVYYEDDIIGSAEIETMKNKYIEKLDREVDLWTVNNIKIYPEFGMRCLKFWGERGLRLTTILSKDRFEGVAVTLGFPNRDLTRDSIIFPFEQERKDISFEDAK